MRSSVTIKRIHQKLPNISIHFLIFFSILLLTCSPCGAESGMVYDGVKLISHRGIQMGYPENSLAAIEAVIENGIHGVEVDLRTTADHHIVIIHDERLERVTTGTGEVRGKSWSEIGKLRLKDSKGNPSSHSVPDLQSVLKLVKDHPHFTLALDLKDVDAVVVAKMVLAHEVQNQVLFFVADPMDTVMAKSITGLHPDLRIIVDMLTWWKIEDIPIFAAKALETDMLFASEWFFPRRGFHHLREQGIEVTVYLWGRHDLIERFKKAAALGASFISTDAPLSLLPHVVPAVSKMIDPAKK